MPSGPRPDPPSRSCRLVYAGHYGGAPWANVMWLYLTGSGEITTANLNSLATACKSAFVSRFIPELRTEFELQSTTVTLYQAGDALQGVDGSIVTGTTSTGSATSASIALCISWHIAPSYRGGHPRTYLCGIPTTALASVVSFSAGPLGSFRGRAASFHTDLEAITGVGSGIATVEHGVVSFVRDGAWREPPVFYRITGSTVDTRIDTQRRRLGRDTA